MYSEHKIQLYVWHSFIVKFKLNNAIFTFCLGKKYDRENKYWKSGLNLTANTVSPVCSTHCISFSCSSESQSRYSILLILYYFWFSIYFFLNWVYNWLNLTNRVKELASALSSKLNSEGNLLKWKSQMEYNYFYLNSLYCLTLVWMCWMPSCGHLDITSWFQWKLTLKQFWKDAINEIKLVENTPLTNWYSVNIVFTSY